ncbi:MAG: hypothetical protein ABSG95_12980 [Solirubrobacteraceae bacterium]
MTKPHRRPLDLEEHLDATYRWLCAAQDATADDGVAADFDLLTGCWSASYPETTGYIIPTFLALAEARSEPDAHERALRMADWEADIQMQDGAVLSGPLGGPRGPAVFNTGQAIFGWISAFQASGNERYAEAARSAGAWLAHNQDADGAWRGESLSMMTTASVNTYNVRCAWALAYAANVLGEDELMQAALQNCEWVLAQQNDAGWFAHTGFAENEVPLLHTISYVIEGLLGVYAFTHERRYLQGALLALDPIVKLYDAGRLRGRLDSSWQGTVPWRNPTGEAQIAVVLGRVDRHLPGRGYGRAARRLIEDVADMQLGLAAPQGNSGPASAGASPTAGGVPGSFPIWGEYMRFALPNWAAKFYLDALLLEQHGIDEKSFPGLSAP